MGRMYSVNFEAGAVTNANGDYDYFQIQPADDKPVVIHAVFVSFYSELGDTQEEIIRWGIVRGHATVGGSPANTNVRALNTADSAFGGTGGALNATIASAGTGVNLYADAFNLRVGLVWIPTPEMRPSAGQGDTSIVVRQFSTVTDDANANGTCIFEELP